VDFVPLCDDFHQYTFSYWFSASEFNHNGYHSFFLLQNGLYLGADDTRNTYGSALVVTAGYRCPDKQNDINSDAVIGGRHSHGDAMDWASYSNDTIWTNIRNAANTNGACVEPKLQSSNNHVHADWRGSCPPGW
jgi:hypothetical protein